ncbi:MAG: hypothetical protein JWO95_2720 [Verrucomicrobiales bacterium]|nr:hypothetical protein [Verrucomicrobiales bacterium]
MFALLRKHFRFVYLALSAFALSCATQNSQPQPAGFLNTSCPPDKALVYIYRERMWHPNVGIKMYVNDGLKVSLHGREYSPLIVDPGLITISREVKSGPYGVITSINRELQLRAEQGQTYYVAYRFWVSPFHRPNPVMVLVDPATARSEMSHC